MKRAGALGLLAIVLMILGSVYPSVGFVFLLLSLPCWLLFVVDLVRALKP